MARQTRHSDESGKRLFSHRLVVADLVRLLGGSWVDDLDLDRLERLPAEHVADDLRARRADMPWWAPFKPGAGRPAGAGVLFHIEFQSRPDARMAERLLAYIALLRLDLHRSGWMAANGGRVVAHVPLVVYNGRAKWNAPRQLDECGWAPELRDLQPRLAYRLVDAKAYAGDDASDGNVARAALALDAASAQGLAAALERAVALFSAAGDQELWRSFAAWCGGVLSPRLGGRLPTLVDDKETTMLAETLREWDEQKIDEGRREGRREGRQEGRREGRREGRQEGRREGRQEGRREGRQEGRREGRQEGRREGRQEGRREGRQEGQQEGRQEGRREVLCSLAGQRFGADTGAELAALLAGVEDGAELERVGKLIIDCRNGADFLARARLR